MRIYKTILLTVLLTLLLVSTAWGQRIKKKVLYFNSYHHGYVWSDEIREGISKVLGESEFKIELQTEYLDAKKYHYDYITDKLRTLYKDKFRGGKVRRDHCLGQRRAQLCKGISG